MFSASKTAFYAFFLLLAVFISCEEEKVEEQTAVVQPPIIVEPEQFPELGHDGQYAVGSVNYG